MLRSDQRFDKVFLFFLIRRFKGILLVLFVIVALLIIENYYDVGSLRIRTPSRTGWSDGFVGKLRVSESQPSEKEILGYAQQAFPSVPITFWEANQNRKMFYRNNSCARFPSVYNLQINNLYWQTLGTANGTFYLFAAYYDRRSRNPRGPTIRILAMIDRTPLVTTYCQMWFANSTEPVIVQSAEYLLVYDRPSKKIGPLYPYQILCPVPPSANARVPMFVSLVERVCDTAPNSLRVVYRPKSDDDGDGGKKNRIAVCVKRLDFLYTDMSVRLVEWIELLGLLGVDKIYFYVLEVHENVTKVLEYYGKRRRRFGGPEVEVTPISLPGGQPNIPGFRHVYSRRQPRQKVRNEIVSHNDCLYKSIYQYDYVLVIDTDEVVVPSKQDTLPDLMETVVRKASLEKNGTRSHHTVGMLFFRPNVDNSTEQLRDIPSYMYMLRHTLRDTNYDRFFYSYPKTFYNTDMLAAVKVHFPKSCIGPCFGYKVQLDDARMHHYRSKDYILGGGGDREKKAIVSDTTVHRYKVPLINRTLAVLNDLNFFDVDG